MATKTKTKTKTKTSVEDKLRALYELQEIDTKLDNIRLVRGELPLEVQDLKSNIEAYNFKLNRLKEELNDIKNSVVENKNSIVLAKAAIEKYEKQLKNIKNNREYSSLTKEIEFQNLEIELSEKNKSKNETSISLKKDIIKSCKEDMSEKEEELKIKEDQLSEIVKDTEKEEKVLLNDSNKASKLIDDRLLSSYKKIRSKVANGLAVVSVERDACGGCFSQIPPQRQLDIQTHKRIIACEHCGRIMIDANIFKG